MNSFQEHYKCVAIGKRVQVIKNTDAGRKVGDPQPRGITIIAITVHLSIQPRGYKNLIAIV